MAIIQLQIIQDFADPSMSYELRNRPRSPCPTLMTRRKTIFFHFFTVLKNLPSLLFYLQT